MSEANKAVVRRIVEDHWNGRNVALAGDLFAPTVTLRTPDGVLEGIAGVSALLNAYATAFPDFHVELQQLLADGDRVILQWAFRGTHSGPFGEIPASGRVLDSPPGIAIFRVEDGKVIDGQMAWDKYAVLQQIGVLPAGTPGGAQAI